jgi:hypothetical protein
MGLRPASVYADTDLELARQNGAIAGDRLQTLIAPRGVRTPHKPQRLIKSTFNDDASAVWLHSSELNNMYDKLPGADVRAPSEHRGAELAIGDPAGSSQSLPKCCCARSAWAAISSATRRTSLIRSSALNSARR